MARPTRPKDLKPKSAESGDLPAPIKESPIGGEPRLDIKFLVTIFAIFVASVLSAVGASYFLVLPTLSEQLQATQAESAHEEGAHAGTGMNLELDEFTVNLKPDPAHGGNQFLRTKMALSVSVPKEEACGEHAPAAGGEGEGGEGGADACQVAFNQKMAKFVPTMRDVINASLMKRTAGALASIEGQEALKDEIKEQINELMDKKYKIVRVNFSDFIIQY